MKNLTTLSIGALLFCVTHLVAQTNTFPTSGSAGIGTLTPNATSILDVSSTTQGMLTPRMTKTQRDAILTPATGLLIYQTNSTPGFYFYTGTAWTPISTKGANVSLSNLSATGTAVNQSLNPGTTGTLDLGSATNRWDEGYINTLRFGDGTSMTTAAAGGVETDPQVGTNTTDYIPKWNGSDLTSGQLQDNGNAVFMGASLYALGSKMSIENTSTTRNLYLVNALTGTGSQEGINNWLQGASTGSKTGIKNAVWQTSLGTGTLYGLYQDIQKYGTGTGYGIYNYVDIIGSSTNHGVYTKMVGGTGVQYGTYTDLNTSGSQYGHYVTLGSSSGNHYGFFVTSTGTTGSHYGLFSQVSTANTASYSAYLVGKVYASGNVGIGETSPVTKLHIAGGTDAGLASGGFITTGDVSSSNLAIDNNEIMARNNGATSTLYLNNDGGNVSMCYASGNVMIGASVPATGYLLSVDGKIMCEELKVQLSESWPDYVFGEKYKLPSLYDLEKSIKETNHLPNIPSADEIKQDGVAVGDMQVKMMEKIEELTLYIIELQKQVDALKAQQ